MSHVAWSVVTCAGHVWFVVHGSVCGVVFRCASLFVRVRLLIHCGFGSSAIRL